MMPPKPTSTLVVILIVLLSSCSDRDPKTELQYLTSERSPYYREIRKNGYMISANYLPTRYFELRHLAVLDSNAADSLRERTITKAKLSYSAGLYFMLTIAYEDERRDILNDKLANFEVWSKNFRRFAYELREYVYLETPANEHVPLATYDFQNTYGMTKDRKILLCFPRSALSSDDGVIKLHLLEWGFGIGSRSLQWNMEELI